MDIIEKIDLISMDDAETLSEAFKKVIRKGKVKRKLVCPVAVMKAKDGKCVSMTAAERKKRGKAAKLRGRKLKTNIGIQKKAQRKRAKSMRKRAMQIPSQGAPSLEKAGKEGEI